jgi:uncharacterized protein YsxB (DUF464 family)
MSQESKKEDIKIDQASSFGSDIVCESISTIASIISIVIAIIGTTGFRSIISVAKEVDANIIRQTKRDHFCMAYINRGAI